MQASSRLASRLTLSSRSVLISSTSSSSSNSASLHTSTSSSSAPSRTLQARHASTVQDSALEIPIPREIVQPSSTKSTASKSKGKGRAVAERELPLRKQFLMAQYKQILSTSPVVVFLKPSDFTVEEITRLRVDLSLISTSSASKKDNKADAINGTDGSLQPHFLFLRAGMLPPVFKQLSHLPSEAVLDHLSTHGSTLAALTLPSLDPPALKAAMKAISKLSKTPNVRKQQAEAAAKAKSAAAVGGAKGAAAAKGASPAKAAQGERLRVVSAIVEGKSLNLDELKTLTELPSLEQILAQLVAVIETPARQIHAIASQAAGGDLARTLEGFKVGLEEKETPKEA